MPAVDQCHEQVKRALQKDGWQLLAEQYRLYVPKERQLYVDLYLSRQVNGTREQLLLTEVKCFPERSAITTELYQAVGQYLFYRDKIDVLKLSAILYLAMPLHVFEYLDDSVERVMRRYEIHTVVIDLDAERVVRWIKY